MTVPEFTAAALIDAWRFDAVTVLAVVVVGGGYAVVARARPLHDRVFFTSGCALWLWVGCGFPGVFGGQLFWARALGVVVSLTVIPLLLAAGRPVTAIASGRGGRRLLLRAAGTRGVRVATSPQVTSIVFLGVPWLLYLTPWYRAVLESAAVDALTGLLLVAVGSLYYYARLQIDPVPVRRHAGVSLLITVGESLGDGVLGVVLWQGPMLAAAYYQGLHRDWGPSPRTDQTIGAGVLWILGDVLSLPLLLLLMRRMRDDDRDHRTTEPDEPWFLTDPRFADRFR
ncbi:hypothetical protein nbrc107696_16550 [Gordonia spumicola]|uniref:Cytochrome c oxidase assembly protein n=1 Tax=Gordonia spumicola TaxID=589161 RepID=A0A7I9V724_9ACTN|nr:cytochrome c oxidase assembly protein [Gordonia spumicola]GEE01209.1 hypothetical protein nbrc107696_16550 [Gordonia spumicola]